VRTFFCNLFVHIFFCTRFFFSPAIFNFCTSSAPVSLHLTSIINNQNHLTLLFQNLTPAGNWDPPSGLGQSQRVRGILLFSYLENGRRARVLGPKKPAARGPSPQKRQKNKNKIKNNVKQFVQTHFFRARARQVKNQKRPFST
jgi:hypothetical protein